jgi:hypothetical protein
VVLWFGGFVVLWFGGFMVLWFGGSVVLWFGGFMVRRGSTKPPDHKLPSHLATEPKTGILFYLAAVCQTLP